MYRDLQQEKGEQSTYQQLLCCTVLVGIYIKMKDITYNGQCVHPAVSKSRSSPNCAHDGETGKSGSVGPHIEFLLPMMSAGYVDPEFSCSGTNIV